MENLFSVARWCLIASNGTQHNAFEFIIGAA